MFVSFQALPVDPTVVRNLRSLRKAETSWNALLDPSRCYRFVYALQVTFVVVVVGGGGGDGGEWGWWWWGGLVCVSAGGGGGGGVGGGGGGVVGGGGVGDVAAAATVAMVGVHVAGVVGLQAGRRSWRGKRLTRDHP